MLKHFLYIFLLLLCGCAVHRPDFDHTVRDWSQQTMAATPTYTVYLVGDAGGGTTEWTPPALLSLKEQLEAEGERSALVFLGDNIYPDGLPPNNGTVKREEAETALDVQLAVFEDYPGRVFYVAGNHDWQEYGVKGVRRQAKYLRDHTEEQAELLPKPGCGDPVEVELTDSITLVLLDSQWWLADWEGEQEINEDCEAKSRADFAFLLQEALKGNRRKELLVAMHHPLYSNGPHGGDFTFSQHLFPLRDLNKNLYVPLPVLGSLGRLLQSSIGTRQDLSNTTYKEWRQLLLTQANSIGGVVFAAAHDHSLQYWERDRQHFIVSGAGSRRSAAKTGNGALFTYGDYGYSQLNYYADGQLWVQYWAAETDGGKRLLFQHQVKPAFDKREGNEESLPTDAGKEIVASFSPERARTVRLSEVDFSRTPTGELLWGEHYREAYASEMHLPEIDLAAMGLEPVKRGGGFQTNSLRLEHTETEKQYTLRSINKDAGRTVPYPLNTPLVLEVVRDNFSASHPLAALAVAPLAEAAGIYHTKPRMVYLPDQPSLGEFNEDYAGKVYLFEERPDDEHWEEAEEYGNPKDVISTFDMLEKTRAEHDERIDQGWTLHSRLFDLVIGDWDRHDDQWRWAVIDQGDYDLYRPIPRDRDQAFANYDGFIFAIARQLSAKSKQWRPFTPQLGRTHWATYNAFRFDQSFLTEMEWCDWEATCQMLQDSLTDEVIATAFATAWPEPFLGRDAPAIIETIKGRRDNLRLIARDYYEFLARCVDVLGTDERDLFLVERQENGDTRVRVYDTNKEGVRQELLYERLFLATETHAIYCYGLGDGDLFEVRGDSPSGPAVHLIGGEGKDRFDDQSRTTSAGLKVVVHDFKREDNQLLATNDSRDRRSGHPRHNLYNRRSEAYNYNYNSLLPNLGFNPDDKLFIGFQGTYTRYGFRKSPFASQHRYGLLVSTLEGGLKGYYTGNFTGLLGPFDLQVDFAIQTPLYASNFYGFGNETIDFHEQDPEAFDDDYHRVRQEYISIAPQLAWRPNRDFTLLVGPRFRPIEIERTPGRFIETIPDEIDPEVFEDIGMLSWEWALAYRNVDEESFPTRGLGFSLLTAYNRQIDGDQFNYASLDAELSLYRQLDRQGKLIFATRAGLLHRTLGDFPFYLGAQLGGLGPEGNLRGFRRDRFTGRTAFFHNTDLRWKAFYWRNNAVPMPVGFTASFDYGKVSLADIESELIHYSYGGGMFVSPFELFTLHVGAYLGDGDDLRWLVGGGFFF